MATARAAWGSIRHRPRLAILAATLAAIAVSVTLWIGLAPGSGPAPAAAIPSVAPSPSPSRTPSPTPTPSPTATPATTPSPSPTPEPVSLVGEDGRFTLLVLGSDYRRGHAGNRTDTIMVVSIDPTDGATTVASIPRDTVAFPLPGGGRFSAKVNGLYQHYVAASGAAEARTSMKRAIGAALAVEIDNVAVIGFDGVERLVDAVGGVDVTLKKAVNDPQYWLSATRRGVRFPAGKNHLDGERALIFARTRKGDNDFERARRQQQLMAAAVRAVRERGLRHLPELLEIARSTVQTDLPLTEAARLFEIVAGARLDDATATVFGPSKWATSQGGSAFSLKLDVIRAWTRQEMAPVRP